MTPRTLKVSLPILLQCLPFLRATKDSYAAQLNTAPFQSLALLKPGAYLPSVSALQGQSFNHTPTLADAEDIQLTPPKIPRVIYHAIHRTIITIGQFFNPDSWYDIGVS